MESQIACDLIYMKRVVVTNNCIYYYPIMELTKTKEQKLYIKGEYQSSYPFPDGGIEDVNISLESGDMLLLLFFFFYDLSLIDIYMSFTAFLRCT